MKKAYTLIELIIVITLVGAFTLGASSFLWHVVEHFKIVVYRYSVSTQGKMAMDSVVREIREVDVDDSWDVLISSATAQSISFTHVDGENITYQLSGTELLRNTSTVCENVTNFQFDYRDEDNGVLTPPLSASDIQEIQHILVSLTLNDRGEVYSMTSWLTLRNVRTR